MLIKKHKKAAEEKAAQAKNEQAQTNVVEEEIEYSEVSGSRGKNPSNMIKWVDDNGVVHITNNVGSVPPPVQRPDKIGFITF